MNKKYKTLLLVKVKEVLQIKQFFVVVSACQTGADSSSLALKLVFCAISRSHSSFSWGLEAITIKDFSEEVILKAFGSKKINNRYNLPDNLKPLHLSKIVLTKT